MTTEQDTETSQPRAFARDRAGSTAPIFGLALAVLAGSAGLAVDYSRTVATETLLQKTLDAAVLAGVSDPGSAQELSGIEGGLTNEARLQVAKTRFDANIGTQKVDSVDFKFEGENLVGRANVQLEMTLLQVLGFTKLNVERTSGATHAAVRAPLCFMAMHPTRKHTLELKEAVSVKGPDCHFYGNSSHYDDVVDPHTPENFLVGRSVQAVGYGHHFLPNVTPPLEHAPELIPDPLAAMTIPTSGACQFTGVAINGGAQTLTPGKYCGGLTISGNAFVTFDPGLYIIAGGGLSIADSEITGSQVTISLADSGVTLNWTSSVIRLSAPKSGDYAGMVLIGVREPTAHSFVDSTIDLHGVVYLLNGDFTWTNKDTPDIHGLWTAWIIDGVSWLGDGTININFNIKDSDVPYPEELYVIPRPGSPRLVH